MIKPEDLRIGDLVRVCSNNCMIPKGAICEVVAIDSEQTCEDKKGIVGLLQTVREEWEFSHGAWGDNIEGIPLTLELLEKNGFKEELHQKEGTSEWYYYYHYDLGINVVYEVNGNKFAAHLRQQKVTRNTIRSRTPTYPLGVGLERRTKSINEI